MADLEPITYGYKGREVTCPDWIELPAQDRFSPPIRRLVTCKRRGCPRCGIPWARDVATRVRVNLGVEGRMILVTITAPGEDVLPWDEHHCAGRHRYGGRHSGKRGCRVDPWRAAKWADSLTYRWQLLRNAAQQATRRALKDELGLSRQPPGARLGVYVWEPQKRGVPHMHLVVAYNTAEDRRAAHVFVRELKRLAPRHEFGFVDARGRKRKDDPRRGLLHDRYGVEVREIAAADAARYLSGYLTGRNPKKPTVRENIANPMLPPAIVWVSPRLTRVTGVTARMLRRARWLAAALRGRVEEPRWHSTRDAVETAAVFLQAFRSRPPPVDLAPALALAVKIDRDVRRRTAWNDFRPQVTRLAFELAEHSLPVAA